MTGGSAFRRIAIAAFASAALASPAGAQTLTDSGPTGPAGGILSGFFPNPGIASLTGNAFLTGNTTSLPNAVAITGLVLGNGASAPTGITGCASGALIYSAGSVPSCSTTLPSGLAATNLALTTPILGTPQSGTATNLTGTAAGLTAGSVTTNANLTGPVTSVGNATTITATSVTNAMLAGSIAASKLVGTDIATVGALTTGSINWAGAIATSGVLSTTNATASTSATTGAAIITGGLGVGGAVNSAGNYNLTGANLSIGGGGAGIAVYSPRVTGGAFFSDAATGDSIIRADTGQLILIGASSGASTVRISGIDVAVNTIKSLAATALTLNGTSGINFQSGGNTIVGMNGAALYPQADGVLLGTSSNRWTAYIMAATDAAHTDTTVCRDTTTGQLLAGSGAVGICLGTSSLRFKTDVHALRPGLAEVMALEAIDYRYKPGHGGEGIKYGFAAEQVNEVLPQLVGLDVEGRPNSVDWAGIVPVLVRAIQEQQAEISALRAR